MNRLFGRRLYAFLIDEIVLYVFVMTPMLLILDPLPGGGGLILLITILGQILGFVYWTLSDRFFGQSLGKQILRIRTVGPDGRIPLHSAMLRNLPKVFNAFLLLDSLPLLGNGERRLTETVADTSVVEWV